MALAIEAIDEQSILVETTDYELEVEITDGTADTEFEITGPWEGFYYDWDHEAAHGTGNETGILTIKSTEVTRLIQDAEWTLTATEGSETAEITIVFNVVPVAPVIEIVEPQVLIHGIDFLRSVAISNNPSSVQVTGLQAGLKFESSDGGVDLAGTLPIEGANVTQDEFIATILASNDGGEHTRDVNFTISEFFGIFAFREDTDDIYTIESITSTLAWSYTALPTAGYDILVASSDGGVFAFRDDTDDIYKIASDGTLAWSYTALPTANYSTHCCLVTRWRSIRIS